MKVSRGYKTDTTAGDRKIVFCEGGEQSLDVIFYKTLLGVNANKFEFKPIGSSNTLLCFAETRLIENGFCLIDRDFRTDDEIVKIESKYSIKFLHVHEIENFFLNQTYLEKLPYFRKKANISTEINKIILAKRVRFLADFLQFKINTHLDKFPRISKLENTELPSESDLIDVLLSQLDHNYTEVNTKIDEIKTTYLQIWKEEYDSLPLELLPGKEIFKELKNKIFNNPPSESDIAKNLAIEMEKDSFVPTVLHSIFQ